MRKCYLGHIPLAQDGSGWHVVGSRYPDTEAPLRLYRDLASQAGAALPLSIRRKIAFAPADPLGWWFTFLWHLNPPTAEDLATPDRVNRLRRCPWPEPLLESIDAIELCKLHTDHPQFPPEDVKTEDEQRSRPAGKGINQRDIAAVAEGGGSEGSEKAQLKPSREKAYRLFLWALEQKPELKTDREVYDWLVERPDLPRELPNFDTWSKYLREARAYYDDYKHTPRTEKPASGKSVVRRNQI